MYVAGDGTLNRNNTDPWARLNIVDAGRILSFLALLFPCTPGHEPTDWFCPDVVGGSIVCVDKFTWRIIFGDAPTLLGF
jgi:hypothetical protein